MHPPVSTQSQPQEPSNPQLKKPLSSHLSYPTLHPLASLRRLGPLPRSELSSSTVSLRSGIFQPLAAESRARCTSKPRTCPDLCQWMLFSLARGEHKSVKPLASAPLIASTEHRRGAWRVVRRRNRVLTMEALPTAELQFWARRSGCPQRGVETGSAVQVEPEQMRRRQVYSKKLNRRTNLRASLIGACF